MRYHQNRGNKVAVNKVGINTVFVSVALAALVFLAGCPSDVDDSNGGNSLNVTHTVTRTSISIKWNSVDGAVNYIVSRDDTELATINTMSYNDTGLQAGKTYSYQVKAINNLGVVIKSENFNATTESLPSVGKVTATAVSSSSIRIDWVALSEPVTYTVYRSASADGVYQVVSKDISDTSYTDTGLSAQTWYYYKVSASLADGIPGPQSTYTHVETLERSGMGKITATLTSDNSVKVSWEALSESATYTVYRAEGDVYGTYTPIKSGIDDTSYTDTSVLPAKTYYYKVSATYADNKETAQSAAVSVSIPDLNYVTLTVDTPFQSVLEAGETRLLRMSVTSGSKYYLWWDDLDKHGAYTAD
jgi:hypothetical protein